MPEAHFACMPISIEYYCDECGNQVMPKRSLVAIAQQKEGDLGFRHECVNPDCAKEYHFPIELPFIQHGKTAPIIPRHFYLAEPLEEQDEN